MKTKFSSPKTTKEIEHIKRFFFYFCKIFFFDVIKKIVMRKVTGLEKKNCYDITSYVIFFFFVETFLACRMYIVHMYAFFVFEKKGGPKSTPKWIYICKNDFFRLSYSAFLTNFKQKDL